MSHSDEEFLEGLATRVDFALVESGAQHSSLSKEIRIRANKLG